MDRGVTISVFEHNIGVTVDQIPEEDEKPYPSIGFAVSFWALQYNSSSLLHNISSDLLFRLT